MSDDEKNKIEEANKALYSKVSDGIFVKRRHSLKENYSLEKEPTAWKEEAEKEPNAHEFQIPYQKIFLVALIFFVAGIGFAAYKFFGGANTVSGGNIDILVTGPVSVAGGEVLPLGIQVQNNNTVGLQSVDMTIDFPAGTKQPDDLTQDLTRYTKTFGDINAGQSANDSVKSVIYGPENTQEVVKVTVEYRIAGSNAIFSKEKDYTVLLNSSPVNITVTGPDQINANQQANFSINVKSNSLNPIKNLIMKVGYPFGFNLTSENPKPLTSDGSVFNIGDLAPGASISINVSGIFQGQSGEIRVLTFDVGNPSASDHNNVDVPFASFSKSVSLNSPSVDLSMSLNQDSDQQVAVDAGSKVESQIHWQNNLSETIYNMSIAIKITGPALDESSVSVINGFYNSSDNSIIFDKSQNSAFASVGPNSEGDASFDFNVFSQANSPAALGNSQINMDITVTGTRAANGSPEVLFSDSKVIKISSLLQLLSRGFRTTGPFENSGPFPPKVDNESTFTITWTATDSWNDVNGAKVIGVLPANVRWTGYTSPDSENITYDNNSGQVVWNIGNMRAGTGSAYPAREVSFQVATTPSISEIGQSVPLLNSSVISGTDAFSGVRIGETKSPVTTNITSDPQYNEGMGNVVQ